MILNEDVSFPSQKRSHSAKTDKWRRECVDGAEALAVYRDDSLRQSFANKKINYDLYSDILDQADIEAVCNPLGIAGLESPAKMQNYPICNPKIDLLVGESIKRRFDFKVRVVNDDAISSKEDQLKEMLLQRITADISNPNTDPEEAAKEMAKFQNYIDFEFQDSKERVATQVLSYLYKNLNLDDKFSKGFKDALIAAEEIYQCDIVAGEPVVKRLNPLHVFTVRSGESTYIEDADIIVIVSYMSPGQIIDEYHDQLTDAQIKAIEDRFSQGYGGDSAIDIGRKYDLPLKFEESISIAMLENDTTFGSIFDQTGNIRVVKAYWKSMRKTKKVKFYDEFGDVQYELYDENHKIDESKGEEETILWLSEWWEGHKIGGGLGNIDNEGIYVKMQPRPVQFRKLENPSICHPGIVGSIYNTNSNVGVSLMDRMKPYQYLYNVLAYNVELMIRKNKGKIMRAGLHEIPENWTMERWLSYAESMNIAFYDAFKEGQKGTATGKLAGSMNAQSPIIDMEMGNSIQLYLQMMQYIKQEMGEIAGVSAARQGQISTREAVGNVEREVAQSSHITEYWFMEHEQCKVRVLECLLETAKVAWKDKKNKKIQYVLDDGATVMFNLDGAEFRETDTGLLITNGSSSHELLQSMKQLAHAGIQNGIMNFSQLLDIYSNESIASIRRKIVRAENEKTQRDQQQAQMQQEMQKEQIAATEKMAREAQDFKREEWDREDARQERELETKLLVEQMRQDNVESKFFKDSGIGNAGADMVRLEDLRIKADKIAKDHKADLAKLEETKRHNKATEDIARSKPKTNKG